MKAVSKVQRPVRLITGQFGDESIRAAMALTQWPREHAQDAQQSHRDRAAGCVIVFAKSRRLELGDNTLQTL